MRLKTKSQLGFFERTFHYKFLADLLINSCQIYVWAESELVKKEIDPAFTAKLIEMMRKLLKEGNYSSKFKVLDIILRYDTAMIEDLHLFRAEGLLHRGTSLGSVTAKDMKAGKTILLIDVGLAQYEATGTTNKLADNRSYYDRILTHVKDTLHHELTHIWHERSGKIVRLQERYNVLVHKGVQKTAKEQSRVYAISEHMRVMLSQGTSKNEFERARLLLYSTIRQELINFRFLLCVEGMAVFISESFKSQKTSQELYAHFKKEAETHMPHFKRLLEEGLAVTFTKLLKDSANPENKKLSQVKGISEHFKKLGKLDKRYPISDFLEILKDLAYRIGPVIPARLFASGMSVEEIAKLNPNQMIVRYEEECIKNNEEPCIAVRLGTKALFNLARFEAEFNRLRKELGVTTKKLN